MWTERCWVIFPHAEGLHFAEGMDGYKNGQVMQGSSWSHDLTVLSFLPWALSFPFTFSFPLSLYSHSVFC